MRESKVSIVIATHNRVNYLKKAIDSVLNQTHNNWELIIVDDGSIDGTADYIFSLKDDRIKPFRIPNSGRSFARNYGIEKADGKYIAFLDDDDFFLPEKLRTQTKFLNDSKNSAYAAVYNTVIAVDEDGRPMSHKFTCPAKDSGYIYEQVMFFKPYPIMMPGMLIRRSALDELDYFDTNLDIFEDIDLWRRLSRKNAVAGQFEPLSAYRMHTGKKGGDIKKTFKNLNYYAKKVFKEHLELSKFFILSGISGLYWKHGFAALAYKNLYSFNFFKFIAVPFFKYPLYAPVLFFKLIAFTIDVLKRRLKWDDYVK